MKYYVLEPDSQTITGPFELDELEAKVGAGELSAGALATGDIGESFGRVRHAVPEDWMPVTSIPGFGMERAEDRPPRRVELVSPPPWSPPPPPLPRRPASLAEQPQPSGTADKVWKALGAAATFALAVLVGLVVFMFLLGGLLAYACRR